MTTTMRWAVGLSALAFAAAAGAGVIELTDTLPGTFIDISTIGTDLHLSDDGYAEITDPIGNALLPAGRVVISNNGGIGFNPPSPVLSPLNESIPSSQAFGGSQAVLVYWDDIGNDVGGTYYYISDNALIVQWNNRLVGTARATFQVQIFDASEATNPFFQFLYMDIEGVGGGASATIGYQDGGTGHNDSQWSYNSPGAVVNGGVLSVIPEPAAAMVMLAGVVLLRRRFPPATDATATLAKGAAVV